MKNPHICAMNIDALIAATTKIADGITPEERQALLEELQERIDIIRHKLKYVDNRPTVACITLLEPLAAAGNWVPEMVGIAGGKDIFGHSEMHPQLIRWEDIQLHDPDMIIVMPDGFSIERAMKQIDLLINRPGFSYLKATKNNQVYIADGSEYFNGSIPNVVDSIELLAEIIQPKFFSFGYECDGWIKFSF
jgi:iron complex transport system substrate-binding protein